MTLPETHRVWRVTPPRRWTVALLVICMIALMTLTLRLVLAWLDPIMFSRWDPWLRLGSRFSGIAMLFVVGWIVVRYRQR